MAEPAWKSKVFIAKPESLRDELFSWKFVITFVVVGLLAYWLSHVWVFEYAGLFAKDWLTELRPPRQPAFTEVVEIADTDLETKFDKGEPLSPLGLSEIIKKILNSGAGLVAVDIDTSSRRYQAIAGDLVDNPRVVWGRAALAEWTGWWGTAIHPLPVLGQNPEQEPRFSGLALFPSDRDWTVRSYANCIETANGVRLPSFVEAILQAKRGDKSASCDSGNITFQTLDNRYLFNTISLHELKNYSTDKFAGKIVLLGGSYSYLDKHPTPFGVIDGVKLVATALEATLGPEKNSVWNSHLMYEAVHWLLKLSLTVALVWIHNRLRPVVAMLATMLLLTFLTLFGMSIAFVITGYSPDFVPFLIGIWIEQLFEGAREAEGHLT